jgi:hypothetical protein
MKHFLIKYRFATGSTEAWHQEIARFIAALENDPTLSGNISYRCMKTKEGSDYYHLAAAVDDQAAKALGERAFFTHYTEASDRVSGGTVEVVPLEIIAETGYRA